MSLCCYLNPTMGYRLIEAKLESFQQSHRSAIRHHPCHLWGLTSALSSYPNYSCSILPSVCSSHAGLLPVPPKQQTFYLLFLYLGAPSQHLNDAPPLVSGVCSNTKLSVRPSLITLFTPAPALHTRSHSLLCICLCSGFQCLILSC
jgi:hypothetical protein